MVLKLHLIAGGPWTFAQVANAVNLSTSGVHGSVQRLDEAQLFSAKRRQVRPRNVLEFLTHGLRYWLPVRLGAPSRGIHTAAAGPPLASLLSGGADYVWPHVAGAHHGPSVVPFRPAVPEAAQRDPALHELLALTETFRVGRARERRLAAEHLSQRLGAG